MKDLTYLMFPKPSMLKFLSGCRELTPRLMDDKDSISKDDALPDKRRQHPIKSGRLCTRDSHMLHRVKWPHKMVVCSQDKAPVYEDISLALFSNGYLAVVSEEGMRRVLLCRDTC